MARQPNQLSSNTRLNISLVQAIDGSQVRRWEQRFDDLAYQIFPRALQWSLMQVAKTAQEHLADAVSVAPSSVINVSKGGAIADGLVLSMRAPFAMKMEAAVPVKIELETAPGAGNTFNIVVALNGVTVGTIPVSGTNKRVSAPVVLSIAADDKITISISSASTAGAAADLGITTLWTKV